MANILIVEDNEFNNSLYTRLLIDHHIHIVDSMSASIDYLTQSACDLIILDIHLPTMSGMELLDLVRAESVFDDVPIFAISSDDDLQEEALRRGANFWMTKPFDVRALLDALDQALA